MLSSVKVKQNIFQKQLNFKLYLEKKNFISKFIFSILTRDLFEDTLSSDLYNKYNDATLHIPLFQAIQTFNKTCAI
jgi:hypothetical protein